MPEPSGYRGFLIEIAAEAIGPVIGGCAGALVAGPAGLVVGAVVGKGVEKAINYFGPRIIDGWWAWMAPRGVAEQINAIEQTGALTEAEARKLAAAAVVRVAPNASRADKAAAIDYLAAIPAAVRQSMVPDRSGRLSCPPQLVSARAEGLMQLLPKDVPPFAVPSDLPNTPYRLETLLGTGGFGAVYKATIRSEQLQPRAIKFCLDPAMVATLHRERDLLVRLQNAGSGAWNDHIVRLYGFDLDYPKPYLVYEFVPGGDLATLLADRRSRNGRGLPADEALKVVGQISQGLAFAHNQGLVHRDLKPANVLVQGARIKLADFGIGAVSSAHALQRSQIGSSAVNRLSSADKSDLFRGSGTLLYMCREQRRGDAPDPKHDIYSLGVMWYQLLVGDVTQELHSAWARELELRYGVPREHLDLINRCVGLMEERPAHARALLELVARSRQAPVVQPLPDDEARRSNEAEAERKRKAEFEKLKGMLAGQLNRDAYAQARATVAAMLRLNPTDPNTLATKEFIDKQLAPEVLPAAPLQRSSRSAGSARSRPPRPSALPAGLPLSDNRARGNAMLRPAALTMLILSILGVGASGFITFAVSAYDEPSSAVYSNYPQTESKTLDGEWGSPPSTYSPPASDSPKVGKAEVMLLYASFGAASLVSLLGAVCMLMQRGYPLAILGCIAVVWGGACPCVLPGVLVGIWALVVLLNPAVRQCFQ